MHHVVRRAGLLAGAALLALSASACSGGPDEEPRDEPAAAAERDGSVAEAPGGMRYVAMGDSFTAAPLVPESVPADGCYRSTGNYPSLVARALPGTELVDVSCSAADTTHLRVPQTTATGRTVPPQLDALTPDTDLVTIGIGGNDFGVFGTLVERCPALAPRDPRGAPCRASLRTGRGDSLLARIDRTSERLVVALREIAERSPQARVLVVGYPQIGPRSGACPQLPVARGDYRYTHQVGRSLDRALRRAAASTEAELVDVWRASRGHDICSDEPWVNGKDTDLTRALSYHPFAEGQAAVAELVLETLDR